MMIGWAWEWPPPACGRIKCRQWVRCSFVVTNYEPGVTRSGRWERCAECGNRRV